jgi:hypothetical protein
MFLFVFGHPGGLSLEVFPPFLGEVGDAIATRKSFLIKVCVTSVFAI